MGKSAFSGNERGSALFSVIFLMVILVGLTAAAQRMSQADITATRNYRSAAQGFYAAEAGITHAIAIINQVGVINLTNDVLNVWPSHTAPFPASPNPMAMQTSYSYEVAIAAEPYFADTNRGMLTSTGRGSDNSQRTVIAHIIKSGIPNAPPGAIYLATDNPTNATFNGSNFFLNGNDENMNGTPGPKPAIPGISARTEANAQETRDSLSNNQKNRVQGLGYIPGPPSPATPSVAASTGPTSQQISQMISDLLALPHDNRAGTHFNGSDPPFGSVAAPKISYLPGDGSGVTFGNGNMTGAGILIVENSLTINGDLDFKGLIIVRGTTQVTDVTGSATIWGSLWTTDFNLTVGGHADVQYSSQALALANLSGGGTGALPAPVRITAWRDVF